MFLSLTFLSTFCFGFVLLPVPRDCLPRD